MNVEDKSRLDMLQKEMTEGFASLAERLSEMNNKLDVHIQRMSDFEEMKSQSRRNKERLLQIQTVVEDYMDYKKELQRAVRDFERRIGRVEDSWQTSKVWIGVIYAATVIGLTILTLVY